MKIDSVLIRFHIKYAELILKLEKKINTHVIILTHIIDYLQKRGCHGHDHMVVGFTTTYTISAYHH